MITNSAIIIANNDDILTEIFLRLPIKSLLRFKSVSKHWLSVITHPYFHRRRKTPISGIIFNKSNSILTVPEFDFISFNGCDSPFTTLEFSDDNKDGMTILSSCNGLLCCSNSEVKNGKRKYYVYNPSTRNFTGLPDSPYNSFVVKQGMGRVNAVTLAFDPAKSPHYNVVLVVLSDNGTAPFHLEVYSSETGKWKRLQRPLFRDLNYKLGVYWNGAVNWFGNNNVENGLYFHVAKERFVTMAMPPRPDYKRVRYMQESYGHLHLIDIHGPNTTKFKVYEMRGDYSGWFVKYEVDIELVMNAFPESVSRNLEASDKYYYKFLTASVVRGEKDGDSFLVFSVPGKVVRYNFADGSFMVLRDFGSETTFGNSMMLGWFDCFQYIESFSCV